MLHVVDIQSGDILQSVPLKLNSDYADWSGGTIIVDGDEVYISRTSVLAPSSWYGSRGPRREGSQAGRLKLRQRTAGLRSTCLP